MLRLPHHSRPVPNAPLPRPLSALSSLTTPRWQPLRPCPPSGALPLSTLPLLFVEHWSCQEPFLPSPTSRHPPPPPPPSHWRLWRQSHRHLQVSERLSVMQPWVAKEMPAWVAVALRCRGSCLLHGAACPLRLAHGSNLPSLSKLRFGSLSLANHYSQALASKAIQRTNNNKQEPWQAVVLLPLLLAS